MRTINRAVSRGALLFLAGLGLVLLQTDSEAAHVNPHLVDTIGLGTPFALAVETDANLIYTANNSGNTVSLIDGASNHLLATVAVGDGPSALAINPVTGFLYVANYRDFSISVLDRSLKVVAELPISPPPQEVAVNPVTNRIYVMAGSKLYVLEGGGNTITAVLPITPPGRALAVNPQTNRIYVGRGGLQDSFVDVIDGATNQLITSIPAGPGPEALAVNPVTNRIYSANFSAGPDLRSTVSVIDGATNTVLATITVNDLPEWAAINPQTNVLYVSSKFTGLTLIDGNTNAVISTIPHAAFGVAVNPATDRLYTADVGTNTVSVFDGLAHNLIATIGEPLPSFPGDAVANANNGYVYIGHRPDKISVVDSGTDKVVDVIHLPFPPAFGQLAFGMALDDVSNRLYVAGDFYTVALVIDAATNQVIADILTPDSLGASISVNPARHLIYIGSALRCGVTVLDGATNSVVGRFPIRQNDPICYPLGVAADPLSDRIYVTDVAAGKVSVMDGQTNTIIDSITVPIATEAITVDSAGGRVFVLSSNALLAIDMASKSVVATVPTGNNYPGRTDIEYSPSTHRIYTTGASGCPEHGTVYVIDAGSYQVIAAVPTGLGTYRLAISEASDTVFASNLCGTVSVIGEPDVDADGIPGFHDIDDDGDGYTDADEKLKGADPLVAASTPEACDGVDNDGDTQVDEPPAGSGRVTPDPLCDPAADADGDTIPNGADSDDDNDGFPDSAERFTGTDALDACPNTPGTHDAWPLDMDRNGAANVMDVLKYKGMTPSLSGQPYYDRRLDLDASNSVNVADVLKFKGKTTTSCD